MRTIVSKFYRAVRSAASFPQPASAPIRRQIYTREELIHHAEQLSERHRVRVLYDRGKDLYRRFSENLDVIAKAYFEFSAATREKEPLAPGVEWLLDNYHLIQQNAREIKKDLPPSYYRKLPKLKRGDFRGYPRVLTLAYEFIAHTDSKIDENMLTAYLESYQAKKPLTIGELWAFPTMLRLVLIENLRRIVETWTAARVERTLANSILEKLFSDEKATGTELLLLLAKELKDRPEFSPEFSSAGYVYVIQALRAKGPRFALAVGFLEERVREQDRAIEEVMRAENQASAANQISMVNIFTSVHTISALNWKIWVEKMSRVHQLLHNDPAQVYQLGDFVTRDRYRHVIEILSQGVRRTETTVTEEVLAAAREAVSGDSAKFSQPQAHVGYHLVGDGREELEARLGYHPRLKIRIGRFVKRRAFLWYGGGITCVALVLHILGIEAIYQAGGGLHQILLFAALFSLPASELASNIVQWIVTIFANPTPLPKLELSKGVPENYRSLVAVHGIFGEKEAVRRAVEALEVRFLGNQEGNIYYGLLADLHDADTETLPGDEPLVEYATTLVRGLNERHCAGKTPRFVLLFRKRLWNPAEGKFMGWERKRGKITELNHLIRGSGKTTFKICVGEAELFRSFRYVITLDLDTQLPRGTAHKMIGTIAHPLNRAVLNPATKTVVHGYGVIQPRVGVSLLSSQDSGFSRIFTGHSGIDPYTHCVSDVYQDLFGEGSFIGKAIFDVEAFEQSLESRVPENALLSHDLFEGLFARCGLATDIELLDDFPARYHVYTRRQHRWLRGDWQLLPWIGPFIPGRKGKLERTPLSNLGRWKLIDNLRRSIVAPAMFLFLLAAWLLFPGSPTWWSVIIVLCVAFPVFANIANSLVVPRVGFSFESYFRGLFEDVGKHSLQALISLALIPHQAVVACDAIVITLFRLFVSRRRLLEWETAYHAERRLGSGLKQFYLEMLPVPFIAAGVWWVVKTYRPEALPAASAFCALWFVSPSIAAFLSRTKRDTHVPLPQRDQERLAVMGWETWCYFDEFIGPDNNYLIPDNIQLVPHEVVARRTSPTNISLSMLSVMAAADLGFTTLPAALERLRHILESLAKLERFNGHFLNWYATDRLATLSPRYVSTVDSGNLAGHFIALRVALERLKNGDAVTPLHRVHLLRLLALAQKPGKDEAELAAPLKDALQGLENQVTRAPDWFEVLAAVARFKEQQGALWQATQVVCKRLARFLDELIALVPRSKPAAVPKLLEDESELTARMRADLSRYIQEIGFQFLFDPVRKLFAIGYNIDSGRRDAGYYDLLASEARLGSLVAIGKGEVEEEHWFMLGRTLTDTPGGRALLSWSGTMFEYLMPQLVTKDYPTTLLSKTYRAVVRAQKAYGKLRGVPWGFSESGYSGVDYERTYQYRAFGVPGLGLKRGLSEDVVVSPYSSFLALPVATADALNNLTALEAAGLRGRYGFFESVDYTPRRLARGEESHLVQSFFAHHQGMSFVSIANVLTGGIFQERFHADPLIKATEILLQERFPRYVSSLIPHQPEQSYVSVEQQIEAKRGWDVEKISTPYTEYPRTHLLSNGRYTVMADNAGSGFSTYNRSIALTRWREDQISNDYGAYIFVRDLDSNDLWSTTYQPTRVEPESYDVMSTPDKIEYTRRDFEIGLLTEIVVSPEDDIEIRRVTVTNLSGRRRRIEFTSYGEVVLNTARAEAAHPAFSNMFVESDFLPDLDALLFARRPRSVKEEPLFMFHSLAMNVVWEKTQFDTSRFSFLGRGRSVHNPVVFDAKTPLAGASGKVLDPIFSLRARIELDPHSSQVVTFVTGFAKTREAALHLVERYHSDANSTTRAFEMAWSQSSVELRVGQYTAEDAVVFQRLANVLLFNVEAARAPAATIARNRLQQSGFWRFGVSGDNPIVLVRIGDPEEVGLVQEALSAHEYLRNRGTSFDLLILNEYPGGYSQNFQHELEFSVRAGRAEQLIEKAGGIFLRTPQQLSAEELLLVESVARVVLNGARGTLASQIPVPGLIGFPEAQFRKMPRIVPSSRAKAAAPPVPAKFDFFNGYGGFTPGNNGYQMQLSARKLTPLPWSNVVANPNFGFLITESGGGYTWSENSRENRITPWSNDAVTDQRGEVIYIRDVANGEYWSPTPLPAPAPSAYAVTHRFGESIFETEHDSVRSVLTVFGAPEENAKFFRLRIKNLSEDEIRNFEIYLYCEWVLGVTREDAYRSHITSFDGGSQTLYAVNHYNNEFAGRIAYIGSDRTINSHTGSRFEFIGRHRNAGCPLALDRAANHRGLSRRAQIKLERRTGAGLNSCGVIQVQLTVEPEEEQEVIFFLGEAPNTDAMRNAVARYRIPRAQNELHAKQNDMWKKYCGTVEVTTPEKSFNTLMNGWLAYQTVACRLYGRSGFYQSGGAVGFRDQLQDSLALIHIDPAATRAQILLHAAHQFVAGDVQHWWHPPTNRGVRTTISDDLLWLPYVVDEYLRVTGDKTLLDDEASYLEGPKLEAGHADMYFVPNTSLQRASIYAHCAAAIDRALVFGPHDLPLIGGGDWNDGMNEVGKDGKGESIWLGWFLHVVLTGFVKHATARGDAARAQQYTETAEKLRAALEEHGWDGAWYRRAYFDNGTPLGSATNSECRIDSLAQTWAVISGAAQKERAVQAMDEVGKQLVDAEGRIIRLLTPPFDTGETNPGYIKGYLPGTRENGAQYTHAATWVVLATAMLGRGDEAMRLFQMLNPVTHTRDEKSAGVYKGEPYVLCGDVYSTDTLRGRAGWSWYTGSSGWMYRIGLENILGLRPVADGLQIEPCIPKQWKEYRVHYRRGKTLYSVEVKNPRGAESGVRSVVVDGKTISGSLVPWSNADRVSIVVEMGQ